MVYSVDIVYTVEMVATADMVSTVEGDEGDDCSKNSSFLLWPPVPNRDLI